MWILKHEETGRYVSKPGRPKSFTTKLEHARRYPSEFAARRHACSDETPIEVDKEGPGDDQDSKD